MSRQCLQVLETAFFARFLLHSVHDDCPEAHGVSLLQIFTSAPKPRKASRRARGEP